MYIFASETVWHNETKATISLAKLRLVVTDTHELYGPRLNSNP